MKNYGGYWQDDRGRVKTLWPLVTALEYEMAGGAEGLHWYEETLPLAHDAAKVIREPKMRMEVEHLAPDHVEVTMYDDANDWMRPKTFRAQMRGREKQLAWARRRFNESAQYHVKNAHKLMEFGDGKVLVGNQYRFV
jgi:hypothetical protein